MNAATGRTTVPLAIPSDFPSYVIERDEVAKCSGLKTERYWGAYRGQTLLTRYHGTPAQIIASDFIADKAAFRISQSPRHGTKREIVYPWAPDSSSLVGAFPDGEGGAYIKFADELPLKFGTLDEGTQFFVFEDQLVYCGLPKSLVEDGIARPEDLPREGQGIVGEDRKVGGWTIWLWEARPLSDGRIAIVRNANAERTIQEKQGLVSPANAATFRQHAIDCAKAGGYLLQRTTHSEDAGWRYDQETFEKLGEIYDSIYLILLEAPLIGRDGEKAAAEEMPVTEKIVPRQTDPKFEAFLRNLQAPK